MTEDREPCGPVDPRAVILAPVHRDCASCRVVILALTKDRTPMAGSPPRQPERPSFQERRWR